MQLQSQALADQVAITVAITNYMHILLYLYMYMHLAIYVTSNSKDWDHVQNNLLSIILFTNHNMDVLGRSLLIKTWVFVT